MDMIAYMNLFLVGLLAFTVLLVWARNRKRKQAHYEKIKSNPDNLKWVLAHLSGHEWKDLKTVSEHFGLPMLQAKQLIEFCRNRRG